MSDHTMQAVRVHEYGGPEQLKLEQIPRPEPKAGEVLVQLKAVGVLPAECKMRQGMFKSYMPVQFPYIPGSAFAGVIEDVGPDVDAFQKGQAIFGRTAKGAYAEYTITAIETIALKPDSLSFAEAATISGGATVAWTSLFENGELQADQTVLIHGAAGGLGLFAVQFARLKGAHVIGTASTDNVEFVRSLGAETVIDYTTTPFEQIVHDVDLVLDTIGGETLQRSMQVVKKGGTLISLLGDPSQEKASEYGIRATKNSVTQSFPSTALLTKIAGMMADGSVKTVVAQEFSLAEVQQAHERCQTGHGRGRLVLHIAN